MGLKDDLLQRIGELKKISFREPQRAFEESQEILNEAKVASLVEVEADALIAMSLACRSMTKLNDCFNYGTDALMLFKSMDNTLGIATALNVLGVVYFYYAMFEQALEHFIKALDLLKNSDEFITMSRLYNNLGEVYREVENYEEALSSYQKALEISEKYGYALNKAIILENMGEIFFRQERYEKSNSFYKQSAIILKENLDTTALAEVGNRIGKIHLIRKEYDLARTCFNEALALLESLNNKYFSIDVLINLAELESRFNEGLFVLYLNRAIQYAESINARKKLSCAFKMLSDYYEDKKDFKQSLDYYKRFHRTEQLIESTVISNKLEIIKIELNKLTKGDEYEKISQLNVQLEQNLAYQDKMLATLEKTNERLSAQVILDELTAIPNRRGIQELITKAWLVSQGNDQYIGVFMMDVDHFKRYNDWHGHPEGDKCLKAIAKTLVDVFEDRPGIVGRYGGEEFICFTKSSSQMDIIALAERFRESVEALLFYYEWQSEMKNITLSIGVCSGLSNAFKSVETFYALSDQELYRAKREGRNCICTVEKTVDLL